ncbi:aspartyl-tRNA(Asn)/glutamyl-tRNA(Gln) amidotransferase subunit A [Paenibacillus forsythiae]|uniref:Aspartyl-tRNA(Asn)/glutamyl-tRNA(Gln) amidotransferase subunit A n=3 Tax=Paenibacillus forsythiae TaxID=365616 RepID=A0ABU3H4V4_9BACL|nr:amidase [Paenibacillus forsythiae]MDT3425843.1 aspartyl-tRNA(Asn)/glutamyl-tRNA(Gln) amidotransferase subunit A [Paenibacillus forsythiae]
MTEHLMFQDIDSLSQLIRTKQLSPLEITGRVLQRIDRLNPVLNAYIRVTPEEAMRQAEALHEEMMQGRIRGPLHGIPIAVKDIIQTKGTNTTAGSKVFQHWVPDEDAFVVQRLKEAGAVIVGKANLHEFAMGATTENPYYGAARNPWDLDKIAGGSSGGNAAALAAGMCFGAIGTDTAGSIRQPAALTGTVGLKPTYGRVSTRGCLPFSWSLDHIGPMARTVKDAAILLEAIAGHDSLDEFSLREPAPRYLAASLTDLKGFRIAICREYFFEGMHGEIERTVEQALNRLAILGAEIAEINIPGLTDAQWAARIIAQSEGYAFHKPMLEKLPHLYSDDVKFRLNFGKQVAAEEYIRAQRIRNKFIGDTLTAMEGMDMLAAPMNHNPPFNINSVTPEEAINNMFRLAKAPLANLLGFPALSVPCGFTSGNLPVGLQLIARPFAENVLLQVGDLYERSEPWAGRLAENTAFESGTIGNMR